MKRLGNYLDVQGRVAVYPSKRQAQLAVLRYLFENGLLRRNRDGSLYWKAEEAGTDLGCIRFAFVIVLAARGCA